METRRKHGEWVKHRKLFRRIAMILTVNVHFTASRVGLFDLNHLQPSQAGRLVRCATRGSRSIGPSQKIKFPILSGTITKFGPPIGR